MVSEIIAMISAIILFLNESWAIALYILKSDRFERHFLRR
ncbi:Uncharacterised protein [Vibrio cholerae]|uniref:Uncharacterized protein n=1 Tax=Vibrio cholerae TaxID=666 RepID=A0A655ZZP3_VIBCL|nr:Uncharacterised protein [Vibrio cholerae]